MFDSQKLNFDAFIAGFKHGVYVFTNDACSVCKDYFNEIKDINSKNLYFVEVITDAQKASLHKLIGRWGTPQTAAFKFNKFQWNEPGQLFNNQFKRVLDYLNNNFKPEPLSLSEVHEIVKKEENKRKLTLYIIPPDLSSDMIRKIKNKAYDYKELPIIVDDITPDLNLDQKKEMIDGLLDQFKLVIWKNQNNIFSSLSQYILIDYTQLTNSNFEVRNINEVIC